MAKKRANETSNTDPFSPGDWLPLAIAFKRARDHLRVSHLAGQELFQALSSGRLPSSLWHDGGLKEALDPDFWTESTDGLSGTDQGLRVLWKPQRRQAGAIFVRRAQFDALFSTTGQSPAPVDPAKPPARRRGRPMAHDWFSICGEIARRCINPNTLRLVVPKSDRALTRRMLQWCGDNAPAENEMREAVRRVLGALRSVGK
jgi:hypothetical protein